MKDDSRYALRGVSSGKEEVHKAIKKIDTEVFVVDNNSIDGSVAMIKGKCRNVNEIEKK